MKMVVVQVAQKNSEDDGSDATTTTNPADFPNFQEYLIAMA
jgi:hypothetical protein